MAQESERTSVRKENGMEGRPFITLADLWICCHGKLVRLIVLVLVVVLERVLFIDQPAY
jgi:hypothetical protein